MRLQLVKKAALGAGTTDFASVDTDQVGDFAATLIVKNIGGTTPTVDVKIQEAPESLAEAADGAATWLDLVTFAQKTANGQEKKTSTVPHHERLRVVATIGGTNTPVADVEVILEGERERARN